MEEKALLLYRAISENNCEYFLIEIKDFTLKWLNSFICNPKFLYEFHLVYPLELAIKVGNERIVAKLLEMGENPNPFFEDAIRAGNPTIVKLLIDAGVEIQANNNELLSLAAKRGNLEIIKLLIEKGADVNGYDDDYFWVHPLVKAIARGHIHIYQYLLPQLKKHREILNTIAAQEVARVGDVKTLCFLLDSGIDVNVTDSFWGNTLLTIAVSANQWYMIDYLIERGANVNLQDELEGETALMAAVREGSITMVKKLLAAGASKNLKNHHGHTALDLAMARKDRVIAKLLQSN